MKWKILHFAPLIACCGLGACAEDDALSPPKPDEGETGKVIEYVTVKAADVFPDKDSRTFFDLAEGKLTFQWEVADEIGIFPTSEGDSQVRLSIMSGAGTNSAKFTGGGWALRDDMTYVAYYPYYLEATNSDILFSYEGQHQTGNASLAHLGTHDFMATQPTSAVGGALDFSFEHLNSFVCLELTVPAAAEFTSATLECEDAIFAKSAQLNLLGQTYSYEQAEKANQMTLQLSGVETSKAGQMVLLYMHLFPLDMSGHTVKVSLLGRNQNRYEGTLESKQMKPGRAYIFTSTLVDVNLDATITAPSFGEPDEI